MLVLLSNYHYTLISLCASLLLLQLLHCSTRRYSCSANANLRSNNKIKMEKAIIPQIMDTIFLEVENSFSKQKFITDSILSTLHGIFNKVLKSAFELIETNAVTVLQITDNCLRTEQFIFQVTGSSGTTYVIFYEVNYCQCKFYEQRVLHSKSYPTCKHYLAATLAFIWKKYRTFDVDFNTYTNIIQNVCKK